MGGYGNVIAVREEAVFGIAIIFFGALALSASIITPTFESTDEIDHYVYIQDLWLERSLPVLELNDPHYEAYQPPAYYLLGLLAILPSTAELQQSVDYKINPFLTNDLDSVNSDNKNGLIHKSDDYFPFSHTARAAHLARLTSVFIGLLHGLVLLRLGRSLFKTAELVLAFMALTTLVPGVVFSSGVINNDNAAALSGTLVIWFCWRLADAPDRRRDWVGLAMVMSMATLSKATTLALMPTVGVAALMSWKQTQNRRALIGNLILLVGIWLSLTGWWFARNLVLYGDPIGVTRSWASHGHGAPLPLAWTWASLPWIWQTYWGRFGIGTIPMPGGIYLLFAIVAVLGLVGWAWRLTRPDSSRRHPNRGWIVMCMALGGMLAAVLNNTHINTTGAQGRFLYPAVGAIGALILEGLLALVPPRYYRLFGYSMWLGMALLSAAAIWGWLPGAFALPPRLAKFTPPPGFVPLDFQFGDTIRLHGYTVSSPRGHPTQTLTVTLYWETLAPLTADYAVFLQLVDDTNYKASQYESFPGRGMFPTSQWIPGETIMDRVVLPISQDAPSPRLYWLIGGLWDLETGERLPILAPESNAAKLYKLGEVMIVPEISANKLPEVAYGLAVEFSGGIALRGCEPPSPQSQDATLFWEAAEATSQDYTVFVHVWDGTGTLVAGLDHRPAAGYFPTRFWLPGDWIVDRYAFPNSGLAARVDVGLYESDSLQRLDVLEPPTPNGVYSLPVECWMPPN